MSSNYGVDLRGGGTAIDEGRCVAIRISLSRPTLDDSHLVREHLFNSAPLTRAPLFVVRNRPAVAGEWYVVFSIECTPADPAVLILEFIRGPEERCEIDVGERHLRRLAYYRFGTPTR